MEYSDFDEREFYGENEDRFNVDFHSIVDCVNQVLIFTGVKELETENGPKTVIAYETEDGVRSAFITDSKNLKQVVARNDCPFPFRAIIKVIKLGSALAFRFCNPNATISDEDLYNIEQFKRQQNRQYKNRRY